MSNDEPTNRVTRRTLLRGAALLPGLELWHAVVAGSGVAAAATLLSVPGQAIAEVTGCLVSFSRDGTGYGCNPVFDCGSNTGHTSCSTQSGATVACSSDTCVDMTGNYNCNPAECTNSFVGNCNSLNHCHTATGDCIALFDCDILNGDCNGLTNCDDQGGACNGLNSCTAHHGNCPELVNCPCHNDSQGGSRRRDRARRPFAPDRVTGMPYASSLALAKRRA